MKYVTYFGLIFCVIAVATLFWYNVNKYVTGSYAKYCYPVGQAHGNIKEKLYFKSLAECGKPLKE